MAIEVLKILTVFGQDFQVVIYRTQAGNISFAKRWLDRNTGDYSSLGPQCGLYDSVETAEKEARLRTDGLEPLADDSTLH